MKTDLEIINALIPKVIAKRGELEKCGKYSHQDIDKIIAALIARNLAPEIEITSGNHQVIQAQYALHIKPVVDDLISQLGERVSIDGVLTSAVTQEIIKARLKFACGIFDNEMVEFALDSKVFPKGLRPVDMDGDDLEELTRC